MSAVPVLLMVLAVGGILLHRNRSDAAVDPRRELATVATHLARGSRAGMTATAALAEAADKARGSVGRQLGMVVGRIERGESFDDAMDGWAKEPAPASGQGRAPTAADVELLVVAARFAQVQGSGLAEAFESVATALVDRAELADEVTALTAQARASVAVLCGLPLLGMALVGSIEPRVLSVLSGSSVGLVCLGVAIGLDVAAVALSARLSRWALR